MDIVVIRHSPPDIEWVSQFSVLLFKGESCQTVVMSLIHDQIAFHNVEELEHLPGCSGLRLQRFSGALRNVLGFKDHTRGRFFSHRATGCELRFVTVGKFIRVMLSALDSDAEVIIYRGDYAYSRQLLKAGVITTLFLEEPPFFAQVDPAMLKRHRFAPQVWRISFNQDAVILYHGVDTYGHEVRPPLPDELPALTWLAYGSSITFGGNALFAPNAYVQRAALLLGVDVLNKGLPGSCLCEPEMAEYLASSTWNVATLELGVNLTELATPEEFAQRACALINVVHTRHSSLPIAVLDIYPNRADYFLDREHVSARRTASFRKIVRTHIDAHPHPMLRHIEADSILTDSLGLTADLLHPSDEGHLGMGERLAAALRPLLP